VVGGSRKWRGLRGGRSRRGRWSSGRELAAALGERRRDDGLDVVFCSDLERAAETARIAFAGTGVAVLLDWRLRECDYGDRNGGPAVRHVQDRREFLDLPYPGGESWRQAVARVGRFLDDLGSGWGGARVCVIGHVATRWALDHFVGGTAIEDLVGADFVWREGWEYRFEPRSGPGGSVVQVTVDCVDPGALARFWAEVLGGEVEFVHDDWSAVVDPTGRAPRIVFQRVVEPARAKAAAHLDVRVGQADVASELARLTSLGAVVVGRVVLAETSPTPWTRFVLADPEGNQFCLQ
jgi:2,3-bisphosphoglycerate-dependent phosphoglycerate mutase